MARIMAVGFAPVFVALSICSAYAGPTIFVVDDGNGNTVTRHEISTGDTSVIVSSLSSPTDIAIDPVAGRLFFADNIDNAIRSVNADGSDLAMLMPSTPVVDPLSLGIHVATQRIFWSEQSLDQIRSADLDGGNDLVVVDDVNLGGPTGVFVANQSDKLYWVDATRDQLGRSNLDGTGVEILLDDIDLGAPLDLYVDESMSRALISDPNRGGVLEYDIATDTVVLLIPLVDPAGVWVDELTGDVYVSERSTDTVIRADADGAILGTVPLGPLSNPFGIVGLVPEPTSLSIAALVTIGASIGRRR